MIKNSVSEKAIIDEFLKNASKPSLEGLSYALRHPETWPEGFVWDFSECDNCAMDLAVGLWNIKNHETAIEDPSKVACSRFSREFAIPYSDAYDIFVGGGWMPTKNVSKYFLWRDTIFDFDRITPEMVADQIDKYLSEREG